MRGRRNCSGLQPARPVHPEASVIIRRLAELGFLFALGCLAQAALAENFDYDARRPAELRACDDQRDHGKSNDARACYNKLLNSSKDRATQAEAAWAIGDVRHANELFR